MPDTSEGFWLSPNAVINDTANEGWWFFKGAYCVETNDKGLGLLQQAVKIEDRWPVLRGTIFVSDLDSVARNHTDLGWWFFKGDQCIKVSDKGTSELQPKDTIANYWPVFKNE